MKIQQIELKKDISQFIKIPEKSEIMDIQILNGKFVMWYLSNPKNKKIEVKINIYTTGTDIHENSLNKEYLSSIKEGEHVWHFFMSYE